VADSNVVSLARCPACGGDAAMQIGDAATGFDTIIGGRTFHQPPYAVRQCRACGLYFKSATLSPSELAAYYDVLDGAIFEADADFPTDRVIHRRLRALPDGSDVLDFGCSTGRILKDVTGRLSCAGVEPNAAAAATARSRGIEIISAAQLESGPRRFDAIVLTDVFEHLADPLPVLRLLASRLKAGGWLAIVTGNGDAIAGDRHFAEFWYFRLPGHLIMAGQRHLTWLADRLGLIVDDVHHCSHYRTAFGERVRQQARDAAYRAFRGAPSGIIARVLRHLPPISRADRWTTAPALTYRDDHVVAFLASPKR
jgi:SAM-dependent methyltransferase